MANITTTCFNQHVKWEVFYWASIYQQKLKERKVLDFLELTVSCMSSLHSQVILYLSFHKQTKFRLNYVWRSKNYLTQIHSCSFLSIGNKIENWCSGKSEFYQKIS